MYLEGVDEGGDLRGFDALLYLSFLSIVFYGEPNFSETELERGYILQG
jgi:hypothetical protein